MTQEPNPSPTPRRGVPLWVQILVWIGLLGLLAVLAVSLFKIQNPIITVGSTVPDFMATLYTGYGFGGANEVRLSDLRGQVVVINFWASWCQPCAQEAADLETAWQYYEPAGKVVFLGLDYQDTPAPAQAYLSKFAITYPNGPDKGSHISQLFNRNLGVPETYIVDQQGVLRSIKIGPFMSVAEIRGAIDSILAGE